MSIFKQFFDRIFSPSTEPETPPEKTLVSALAKGTTKYLINDPSTPHLVVDIEVPDVPRILPFGVQGWTGEVANLNPQQQQALNCYITVANCIHYFVKRLGNDRASKRLRKWPGTPSLMIVPRAGKMLNAYYDRRHLKFFFDLDPKTMKTIYTADSSDIVAHELGHALLDSMRPDFFNVQALEIWALHEAFADITAIVSLMRHPLVLEFAISQTKNDLMQSNAISRLAEQIGNCVYHLTGGQGGRSEWALRDATRRFLYVDPKRLPKKAPPNQLAAECHSFGRVFLGAWYEIMVRFQHLFMSHGRNPTEALEEACDTAFDYFVAACLQVPRSPKQFEVVAKTMIALAKGKPDHRKLMQKVFAERKICHPQIKMLNIQPDKVGELEHIAPGIAMQSKAFTMKLADYIPEGMVSTLSVGGVDLADVEVEVAADSFYTLDEDTGNILEAIEIQPHEMVDEVRFCALMIQNEIAVGPDEDTMWEIQDGKLLRTFII